MTTVFEGRFFDGATAADRQVSVAFESDGLHITDADALIHWQYKKLIVLDSRSDEFRLGYKASPDAILVLPAAAQDALVSAAPKVHGSSATTRRFALGVGVMIAAAATIGAALFIGVPAAAGPLTRSTPKSLEVQIGANMAAQINSVFRPCKDERARTLMSDVLEDMAASGDVGFGIEFTFVRTAAPNAFALPGGHVMATSGLLDAVGDDQEAFLAVMAHELGHVRGRDGMRAFYRNAGLGVALEIITGGSGLAQQAVLIGGQLTQLRHTREQEAAADESAFAIMRSAGLNPAALGRAFDAITHSESVLENDNEADEGRRKLPTWLKSHPDTKDRIERAKIEVSETAALPFSADEWSIIKEACRSDPS